MGQANATACLVIALMTTLGCSEAGNDPTKEMRAQAEEPVTFVDRVWRVAESSSVAPGHLYVFLSDGTLVIAFPNGKPALGTWTGEGRSLTMVEEGISYQVDILALSQAEFRIRSHNPGGSAEIRFVPAMKSPPPARP